MISFPISQLGGETILIFLSSCDLFCYLDVFSVQVAVPLAKVLFLFFYLENLYGHPITLIDSGQLTKKMGFSCAFTFQPINSNSTKESKLEGCGD